MKKIIALILGLILLVNCVPVYAFATAADTNPYICYSYSDCTEDGGEIYEVIKRCPVRTEHKNTGEILTRLDVGMFVSVKETKITSRLTRWARIEYPDGDKVKSAWCFIGNLEKHTHRMTTLLKEGSENLQVCYSCGHAVLKTDGQVVLGNLNSIMEQAILGDFSDESVTILGFVARCIVSEHPLADVRDILSDLWQCRSWEVVALDAAGLIPIVSIVKLFAKNADVLPEYIKHAPELLKMAPEFADGVYAIGKYKLRETVLNTFLYGNKGLNAGKTGIQGAHNLSAFMDSLKNVKGTILQRAAHPSVDGVYNIAYTFEKSDGVTATARIAKTVYDPDKIPDMKMMQYMTEAFQNPIKVPGTVDKYIARASNGLWFEGTIDDANEITHFYLSLDNLGAKYGIR